MEDEWDFSTPSESKPRYDVPRLKPSERQDFDAEPLPNAPMESTAAATHFGPPQAGSSLVGKPKLVNPPLHWLAAALLVALTALLVGARGSLAPRVALLGWTLGGFVASGLLAVFTLQDAQRRADPWYATNKLVPILRLVVILAAFSAVALSSWRFADWVAR